MKARIAAVEYALPKTLLTNEELSGSHPDWKVKRIAGMTGIESRHIAAPDEYTSDLAIAAARALFDTYNIDAKSVDYLILCTQTPDFYLPTTACVVQGELGMRREVGAIDITLGCSGYIYALSLARGLIESKQTESVLVITAETHSKLANPDDKSTRPIFGDGATATLVVADESHSGIGRASLGTDGSKGQVLVVPNGGLRDGGEFSPASRTDDRSLISNGYDMYMDGSEIFNFTLRVVPECVNNLLEFEGTTLADIDLFVFHQANGYLIEHLRKKLGVPEEKFVVALREYGNTGSSTIPIALVDAIKADRVRPGDKIMLVGFGVGLSWGGVVITW